MQLPVCTTRLHFCLFSYVWILHLDVKKVDSRDILQPNFRLIIRNESNIHLGFAKFRAHQIYLSVFNTAMTGITLVMLVGKMIAHDKLINQQWDSSKIGIDKFRKRIGNPTSTAASEIQSTELNSNNPLKLRNGYPFIGFWHQGTYP